MTRRVEDVLRETVLKLKQAGIESAIGDARLLCAAALDLSRDHLTLELKSTMPAEAEVSLDAFADARIRRQPVSQILGRRMFWGREFKVSQAVLDPRPETEILISKALEQPFSRVLDLGTGSGCILLSLLAVTPTATGTGVDVTPDALKTAIQNRDALSLQDHAWIIASDWFSAIEGQFDLIVSNPPYIAQSEMAELDPEVARWEPELALCPGATGLEAYKAIANGIIPHLTTNGRVLLEIGPTQAASVTAIFEFIGLTLVGVYQDFDGRDRVVELQLKA